MGKALRPTILATAAAAVALTVVLNATSATVAYRAPEGHVAIETAAALVALLVAFIVLGRFLQTGELADLLLAAALGIIGVTNLAFAAIPAAADAAVTHWATWAAVCGRLLGSLGVAVAALAPERRLRRPRTALGPLLAAMAASLTVIAVVTALLGPDLPLGLDPSISPNPPAQPRVVGNAAVLALQLVQASLYAVAALGFLARAERHDDRLMGWMAVASVLHAVASLNYFLFPSLYSQWVFAGDALRVGFFVTLLVGAALEIQHYQRSLAAAAALEERRRLARELHDGLAQELAFIATQTRWLSRDAPGGRVDQLVVAAERALDESRSAISALTRPLDEPLDAALAQAAEDVAGRVGVRLRLDLQEGIEVAPPTRAALVRIVREAVTNTARHGKASTVLLRLSGGDGVRVTIEDDGIGFDVDDRDGRGFGLRSMSERARALGGELSVDSAPGSGTRIEVVLP